MSYLFINPVNFVVENAPLHSIPLLMGILKDNNIEVSNLNLNSELLKNLKKPDFISDFCNRFDNINKSDSDVLINEFVSRAQKTYPKGAVYELLKFAPVSLKILKDKNLYYNLSLSHYAYMNLHKLFSPLSFYYSQILHLLIPDCETCRSESEVRDFSVNINLLDTFFASELNILRPFIDLKVKENLTEEVECVGITINNPIQFVTGLYIGRYLKQNYRCHVNIGGSFFNEYYECLVNLGEFFGKYFDSISVKNNTQTAVDIIKYLRGEIDISSVPNILYYDGEVRFNSGNNTFNYNKLPYIDLGEISSDDYSIPELVIPIQASTSCYWRKCIFCDCSANEGGYTVKSISRLVDEIENLKNKYNSKYFYFWDNALHPKYLDKLADELEKRKIEIVFSIYARFEEEFDEKLLKKLRRAGLLHVCWGLDSASKRVIEYINKGIDLKNAERILKAANKLNIYSKVYLIFGHPTETLEEIRESVNFVNKNSKYIGDVIANDKVYFLKTALLETNRDYYKSMIRTKVSDRDKMIKDIKKYCFGSIILTFSPTCLLYLAKFRVKTIAFRMGIFHTLQKYSVFRNIIKSLFELSYKKADKK
ncbi:radical SAM protein [bacterium]|nr:radical SAM protein [bacterium]